MRKFIQILVRILAVSALSFGMANVGVAAETAASAVPFPAIVETYIKAWEVFDGEAVAATIGADGTYIDLFNKRGIRGERLVAYVLSRKGSKLTTESRTYTEDGKPNQRWNFYDGSGNLVVSGNSIYTVVDGKLTQVNASW
ncbi:MAG: hypothetical protein V4805_04815 [Pseudomonadota bacterium]